eukprot:TRINITY_DN1128_c1_g2_i1.p1 TRINITY_DN1128_c1_g2~~TRINITY_DN1128_c1_g2_i1.p1  ORF type:complete len:117 (+),score=20.04 TRINITY_DN1128_c1_g2_i1:27-377(+)
MQDPSLQTKYDLKNMGSNVVREMGKFPSSLYSGSDTNQTLRMCQKELLSCETEITRTGELVNQLENMLEEIEYNRIKILKVISKTPKIINTIEAVNCSLKDFKYSEGNNDNNNNNN